MSEEQAIETENEIIDTEADNVDSAENADTTETEEVEIVVEGEDKPTSVPLHALHKRLGRERKKTDAAHTEAEEAQRKAAMLEEENKLLRLQQAQLAQSTKKPNEDDFETDAEYEAAKEKYDNERIERIAKEQAAQIIQDNQTKTAQSASEGNLNQLIDKHYERSAELNVPDYSETETVAADMLGDDIAKQIVANTDNSHLLMYHLGKNPEKAESLKALIENNPMKGVMEIGRLAGSLKVKPKTKIAPDPETIVDSGLSSQGETGSNGVRFE